MSENLRRSGNFPPSLWGDQFSSFTLDTQLLEKFSEEVEVLKEEVKDMLAEVDDVGRGGKSAADKVVLIDTLERLGVSYLFEKEIEEILKKLFPKFEEYYSHVFDDNGPVWLDLLEMCFGLKSPKIVFGPMFKNKTVSSNYGIISQLNFACSGIDVLLFLLYRDSRSRCSLFVQQFHKNPNPLSSFFFTDIGVFKKFKDGNGEFKETISSDVMGMLSLYEATYLKTHGEDILDEAFCFTKAGLESLKPHLSPYLGERVTHALYQSLQRGIPRVEARYYISFYENDPSRNEKLLRLAKIDFNRLLMLHKEELCHISRWWKELDVRPHVPYTRDRAVELFLCGIATYFEPQYALARSIYTKSMILISAVDDTYDAYGTYEELKLFTNAMQRWNAKDAMDQLPEYMKGIYTALQNFLNESHEEMSKQERTYGVHYLAEAFKEVVRCYDLETEWLNKGHVPPFDEYFPNALVSIAAALIVTASFIGMEGQIATPEAFEWLQSKPKFVMAFSAISRILNDIMTREGEEKKGNVATGVECYMKQHGVSKSEAICELYKRVENAWKDINEEMMNPTAVSKDLLLRGLNVARIHAVFYKNDDAYTKPEMVKDLVLTIFGDPIPI